MIGHEGLPSSDNLPSIFLFHFLSPSLRCWLSSPPHPLSPVSWQHPCPDGLPPASPLLRLALSIISGHCYRHLCSSRWPPAGDAGLFCCSTCGHPAARALGSTGTLRSLPAPKPTPAGRGGRTSPGTATTLLLSEGEGCEGWRREGQKMDEETGRRDMTEQGKGWRDF